MENRGYRFSGTARNCLYWVEWKWDVLLWKQLKWCLREYSFSEMCYWNDVHAWKIGGTVPPPHIPLTTKLMTCCTSCVFKRICSGSPVTCENNIRMALTPDITTSQFVCDWRVSCAESSHVSWHKPLRAPRNMDRSSGCGVVKSQDTTQKKHFERHIAQLSVACYEGVVSCNNLCHDSLSVDLSLDLGEIPPPTYRVSVLCTFPRSGWKYIVSHRSGMCALSHYQNM